MFTLYAATTPGAMAQGFTADTRAAAYALASEHAAALSRSRAYRPGLYSGELFTPGETIDAAWLARVYEGGAAAQGVEGVDYEVYGITPAPAPARAPRRSRRISTTTKLGWVVGAFGSTYCWAFVRITDGISSPIMGEVMPAAEPNRGGILMTGAPDSRWGAKVGALPPLAD